MFLAIVLFVFGLAFGSFLNVVAYRYTPGGPLFSFPALSGRSRCRNCHRTLKAHELVPVLSFLWLRFRCAACRSRISFQYPLIEFVSGLVFVGMPIFLSSFYRLGNLWYFRPELWSFYLYAAVWVFVLWLLLLLSAIDVRTYLIPNTITALLFAAGIIVAAVKALQPVWFPVYSWSFFKNFAVLLAPTRSIFSLHVLGFAAALLFFLLLVFLTRGRGMGWGDVKLAAVLGLLLGWPDIILALALAFVIGGIVGAWGVLSRRLTLKSALPFGPFLALGAALTVFLGHSFVSWYFSLFTLVG